MVDKQNVFNYLDALRARGTVNMFGSVPYVRALYPVSQADAVKLVAEWMETFGERHPTGEK